MNKKAKRPRRLVLHRETLLRLDERRLHTAAGGGRFDLFVDTEENNCTSPRCGPTTCGCEEIG